jgi:hypothetical protein
MQEQEMSVDYIFSDSERDTLAELFLSITDSPYEDYSAFSRRVCSLVENGIKLSNPFYGLCTAKKNANLYEDPYVMLKNCPVDPELPYLDLESPVVDKRKRKKTYVAEAFLEFYARVMGQEPIGYINVNDGDIFQDIHPMRELMDTQSQKGAKTIYFHKDLANHFVRPDWVNILGLRASADNEIYTSFVKNKDLVSCLSAEVLHALRQPEFYTPYDDLTVASKNKPLGRAPNHPILGGAEAYDIRFFEKRTVGLTERAKEAVRAVILALHTLKKRILFLPGDFIGSANNECVHNKEVVRINDQEAVYNRWLMKTVNIRSLHAHAQHMMADRHRVVNG